MGIGILAIGDNVVDRYPDQGEAFPGGNAVNVAVHARRCGAVAGYIGAVGTDPAGDAVREALVAEDVDISRLRVVPGPNAYAVVRIVDGNRVFGKGDVGVSRFVLDEQDLNEARHAELVHTGECSMVEQQLPALAAAAARLSFDFSERSWPYVVEHARYADIATISRPGFTADAALAEAHSLQSLGPQVVIVTLGAAGAMALDGDHVAQSEAPSATIVDTLGAGDAFLGRFLAGLQAGESLDALLPAATAYATASCASRGAFGYATSSPQELVDLEPQQHKGVHQP